MGRTPLSQVPELIQGARASSGLDSGMSHLSAALGTPTVVIFSGFADITLWAPGGVCTRVLYAAARCTPCILPSHEMCPCECACMGVIGPGHVLAALAEVVDAGELAGVGGDRGAGLAVKAE